MKSGHKVVVLALFMLLGGVIVQAALQAHADLRAVNVDADGLAVAGYDVVAYARERKAVKGRKPYQLRHQGAIYRFASDENMATFRETRKRFLPEFGGYCAYGVRMGRKLPIDPNAYVVVDDKLYMFLDQATMLAWHEDRAANIKIANKIWPELKNTN